MKAKTIGIFGSYAPAPGAPLYQLAYDLGLQLAQAGFRVLNGGYDGTMRAAAQGAKEAGGKTIGVTCPTVLRKRGASLKPNEFIDEVWEEPTLFARIETMMRRCGGYVFLEGGTGTLSELGAIWEYVNKGFISKRPVVVVGSYWLPLLEVLAHGRPGSDDCVFRTESARQVCEIMAAHAVNVREEPRG